MTRPLGGPLFNEAPVDEREEGRAPDPVEQVDSPSWIDAAAASWRLANDDSEEYQASHLIDGYQSIEDRLVEMGHARERYRRAEWGNGSALEFSENRRVALLSDMMAAQRQNPRAFGDVPQDRAGFEMWARRRMGGRDRDMDLAARGGFGTGLIPGLLHGVRDMFQPENLPMLAMGGAGAATKGGFMAREIATGFLTTGATAPQITRARQNMGEEYSGDDMMSDALIGGAAAGIFAGVPLAIGHAVNTRRARVSANLPAQELVDAIDAAAPSHLRTPTENAARHVLQREADIDAANPFEPNLEGMDAHAERLTEAMRVLDGEHAARVAAREQAAAVADATLTAPPVATASPAPVQATPRAAARGAARGPASIDGGIVSFFRAKGYSEAQARGIAAGIEAEARSNHGIVNPTSGAYGLGQWLGPRKRALFQRYGSNPTRAQQLEFMHWELQGGDHGGRAVLSAQDEAGALNAYIRNFMRPAAGAETSGDLTRGMAALGRTREAMPDSGGAAGAAPQWSAGEVDAPAMPTIRAAALDAERPAMVAAAGIEIPIGRFRAADIGGDAEAMQFKSGGDARGVTDRLRGVEQWNSYSAGVLTVWEGTDGWRLIADGHQRLGLAQRIMADDPSQDIQINAFVMRESDGFSIGDARMLTALKNISEGTGTALDAAKVFREVAPEMQAMVERILPRNSAVVRDGRGLVMLEQRAFGAIVNDVIPQSYGAAVGRMVPEPAQHMAIIDLLAKTEPANQRQAESIIKQALSAGFHTEHQENLFGGDDVVTALFAQRAKVLDRALTSLRKMKGVFQVAAHNADTLESAGSRIAVDEAEAAAQANARALALVEGLAYRKGHVADLLNTAARRIADGEPISRVVDGFVRDIRGLDLDALISAADDVGAVRAAGADGGSDGAGGRASWDDGENGGPFESVHSLDDEPLSPADRDALEAAGQSGFGFFDNDAAKAFDDPAGPGVQAVADSDWHNITADLVDDEPGALFDLGDGSDARSIADIKNDIDTDLAAIDAARRCM